MELWLEVYACSLGVPKVLFSVPLGRYFGFVRHGIRWGSGSQ